MKVFPLIRRRSGLLSIPALAASFFLALPAMATVDDAHGFAMEAAMPFVDQGFIVREDYWNGEVKNGQKLMIRHQLFKGNEYAFWLGTSQEDVTFELKVYDDKGKAVDIDSKTDQMFHSVRVNPPKTGTYSVVFSLSSKKDRSVIWALAYGYR